MFAEAPQNARAIATAKPEQQLIANNAAAHRRQHHAAEVQQALVRRDAAQQGKGFPFGNAANQQRR